MRPIARDFADLFGCATDAASERASDDNDIVYRCELRLRRATLSLTAASLSQAQARAQSQGFGGGRRCSDWELSRAELSLVGCASHAIASNCNEKSLSAPTPTTANGPTTVPTTAGAWRRSRAPLGDHSCRRNNWFVCLQNKVSLNWRRARAANNNERRAQ